MSSLSVLSLFVASRSFFYYRPVGEQTLVALSVELVRPSPHPKGSPSQ
jgi:hypothetical protein